MPDELERERVDTQVRLAKIEMQLKMQAEEFANFREELSTFTVAVNNLVTLLTMAKGFRYITGWLFAIFIAAAGAVISYKELMK